MSKSPWLRYLLLAAIWPLFTGVSVAERVHVTAASGDVGHAWLFGSEWGGAVSCWLALPRHVASSLDGRAMEPFTFIDSRGRSGQSDIPIWIGEVEGAVEAAGGNDDLAFARVFAGPDQCLSRLGPPAFAFERIASSLDQLDVWSMSAGSYAQFKLTPIRVQTADGGGLLRLSAEQGAKQYLAQGLSGAVGTLSYSDAIVPFALIMEVNSEATEARALRFDRVRAAFDKVQAFAKVNALEATIATNGVPYSFDEIMAMNIAGGPLSLGDDNECWTLIPMGGKRSVELITTVEVDVRLQGVTLSSGPCGDASARIIVEQRPPNATSWTPVSDCQFAEVVAEAPACLIDLRGPRQLRIKIIGDGQVSIDDLRIY